jgi:transposase
MQIIGCDFHPAWQQVAMFDSDTGELVERKLKHGDGEAERFYAGLPEPALIGVEACGNSQWFLDMVGRLGHVILVGDAAAIRASYVRRQKTDRRDAAHILKLLMEDRFPKLWIPSMEQRDGRQLLIHRHKLVEMRTRVKNGLQHLCLNQGVQRQSRLWAKAGRKALDSLPLRGWSAVRREDLLGLLRQLDQQIDRLDAAAEQAAFADPQARLLMTQPGVGPITALAFVLTIGDVSRFSSSKKISSYIGLIPGEYSSGGKQRLGAITKQGNCFLRSTLVEAAQTAVRLDPEFKREYQYRSHRKSKAVAKVAAARKLAVRLYWMLRTEVSYPAIAHIESSPRVPLVGAS